MNEELKPGISVIVPVYNGAETIRELVERLEQVLKGQDHEIILVNDGSRDGSWGIIESLAKTDLPVVGLDMFRNYGQHNALLAGIRAAIFDVSVTIDDDLQHPPEEMPKLLDALTPDIDVIHGRPETRNEQHGWTRDLMSRFIKMALQSVLGVSIARQVYPYRVIRTRLRAAFERFQGPQPQIDVLVSWATTRFGSVLIEVNPRQSGASNYTYAKLFTYAMNLMTGFSVLPLRIASVVGFGFSLFGALVLVFVLGRYLFQGSPVQGFPFLASLVAIFSGVQILTLGVFGEYLAKMHMRLMDMPTYIVRERI